MKKSGLLAAVLLAAVVLGGCGQAEEGPVYNFSTYRSSPLSLYAVEYEGTIYFNSFYDEFYSYRDGTMTLLETEFDADCLTRYGDFLYYYATKDYRPDGYYRRRLSADGSSIGEPEKLYDFSGTDFYPSAAWTDGENLYFLDYEGLTRVDTADGEETVWPLESSTLYDSLLVWNGELYLNDRETYSLSAVDLETGEKRTVSEELTLAMGVEDGKLVTWSPLAERTEDEADDPIPIMFSDRCLYYQDGSALYVKNGDEYIYACSVPIVAVLLDPQFMPVGDCLLLRSWEPVDPEEIDHNIPGADMTDTGIYQYLLEPDGELTLLLADDVRFPLA